MLAATALHEITLPSREARNERDEAILVNVREADEYARERIAGACIRSRD